MQMPLSLRSRRVVALSCGWLCVVLSQPLLADPPAPKFLLEWGQRGDAPGEFYSPIGLAFNSKDELFVTDLNNARVQKFSADGKHLGGFDLPRDKPERKSTIIGGIAMIMARATSSSARYPRRRSLHRFPAKAAW